MTEKLGNWRNWLKSCILATAIFLNHPQTLAEESVNVTHVEKVGDKLVGVTASSYSFADLEEVEKELENSGYHVVSKDEIDIREVSKVLPYNYLLLKEGLLNLNSGEFCPHGANGFACSDGLIPDKAFRVLVAGEVENNAISQDLPFCTKRCYDARAILLNGPISWNSLQSPRTVKLRIKKGFVIKGYIRPYGEGCFIQGKYVSLCISGERLTLSVSYPSYHSVSVPIQMKYWNSFMATVNPNVIALLLREHGTNEVNYDYVDLGYQPIDQDKVGFVLEDEIKIKPLSKDPYEWIEFTITSGKARDPFCSEQIAICSYNALGVHIWSEGSGDKKRFYYGAFVARNITENQQASSLYKRKDYETQFNTGDLYTGEDSIKQGIEGYWIATNSDFGLFQKDYKDVYIGNGKRRMYEDYGFSVDSRTLTPRKTGFYRKVSDYPNFKLGFESNRKPDWLKATIPYPALWKDEDLYFKVSEFSKICAPWSAGSKLQNGKCYYTPVCPRGSTFNRWTSKCETQAIQKCGTSRAHIENGYCVLTASCPSGGHRNRYTKRCEANPSVSCPSGSRYDRWRGVCRKYFGSRNRLLQRFNLTFNWSRCNRSHFWGWSSGDAFWFESGGRYVPYGYHEYSKVLYTVGRDGTYSVSDYSGYVSCSRSFGHSNNFSVYSYVEYKKPGSSYWYQFWGNEELPRGTQIRVAYYVNCYGKNGCNIGGTYGYIDLYEVYSSCPYGWHNDGNGYCSRPPYSVRCPAGYWYDRSAKICVANPTCPSGYSFDRNEFECKKYIGQACPDGFNLSPDGKRCQKAPTCPQNTTVQSGYCVGNPELSFDISKVEKEYKFTDDGIFKKHSPLCPEGEYELYQRDGEPWEGYCFKYMEKADCYKGTVNGLDEDRFGNYCYLQLKRPPDVCPRDGRIWTLMTPPRADYVCETTKKPTCGYNQIRRRNNCYDWRQPKSCYGGYVNGEYCIYYASSSCPSGYSYNSSIKKCVKYGGERRCKVGKKYGSSCYLTKNPSCPSGSSPNSWGDCMKNNCSGSYSECRVGSACPSDYYYSSYYGKCMKYVGAPSCPDGQYYDSSLGRCIYGKTTPNCPYGYSFDYYSGKCKKVENRCSYGYSYDYSTGKCLRYSGSACRGEYSYDGNRDVCYYRTPAKCANGERKRDPDTGWSACYVLEKQTVNYYPFASKNDPGRIYCRNGYYYWHDRCYRKDGIACDGQYFKLKNAHELVVIGRGNGYNEWQGTCWKKIKDKCSGTDTYPLRGEFSLDIHCLKLKKELSTANFNPSPSDFAMKFCDYLSRRNFNEGCRLTWDDNRKHDAYAQTTAKPSPQCPINGGICEPVGADIYMCGTQKVCIGCGEFAKLSENPGYAFFRKIHQEGNLTYGISWFKVIPDYIQQTVSNAQGRLPKKNELQLFAKFFGVNPDEIWYEGDPDAADGSIKKYVGIVWDDYKKAGFLGECVTDDNGDALCTADMVPCIMHNGRWECPYEFGYTEGSRTYKCQPYKGKYYCSRYSDQCRNMADDQYAYENMDTPQGINDKKPDGEVTEQGCQGNVYIFNGRDLRCRPPGVQTGMSDCCKKKKDWFGLGYCNKSEQELAALRAWGKKEGQCHYVGSYCALKVFGVCLQKKRTYCCFHSVLARIVQEQGRKQLGIDWGSPKSPNCRGLTPDEFQKIDFSKIDFSEWYSEIEKQASQGFGKLKQEGAQRLDQYFKQLRQYGN